MNRKFTIIAEIGTNHMGDINLATQMIDKLSTFPIPNNVQIIKFQKRTPKEILTQEEYNSLHPNPKNSFGKTYGLHREYLEFTIEQHKLLKQYCENHNFIYSTSIFDKTSAKEILSIKPKIIKLSSANNTDYDLIKYLNDNYDGELHISLGMTTRKEEEKIINTVRNKNKLVLFACTSAYPTEYKDTCLLEIQRLKQTYKNEVKAIGFSAHHIGIIPDIAAATLGAEYIERHFTLNKNFKGTDQPISLNPDEMLELCKNLNIISETLTLKPKEILDVELEIRNRLKYKGKHNQWE